LLWKQISENLGATRPLQRQSSPKITLVLYFHGWLKAAGERLNPREILLNA
jgi:hypothetical protein